MEEDVDNGGRRIELRTVLNPRTISRIGSGATGIVYENVIYYVANESFLYQIFDTMNISMMECVVENTNDRRPGRKFE